jgi:hypothetical protein
VGLSKLISKKRNDVILKLSEEIQKNLKTIQTLTPTIQFPSIFSMFQSYGRLEDIKNVFTNTDFKKTLEIAEKKIKRENKASLTQNPNYQLYFERLTQNYQICKSFEMQIDHIMMTIFRDIIFDVLSCRLPGNLDSNL